MGSPLRNQVGQDLAKTSRELIRAQAPFIEPLQTRPGRPSREELRLFLSGLLIRDPISNVLRIRILNRIVLDPSVLATTLDLVYPNGLFAFGYAVRFCEYPCATGISGMEERGARLNYRWCGYPLDRTEQQGDERFGSRNPLFTPIIVGLYGKMEGRRTLARDRQ